MSDTTTGLRKRSEVKHPIELCFTTLADHSPAHAFKALSDAVHQSKRDMNAYDWVCEALPGAELKPAFAFGTVGELYRGYSRVQEYSRYKETLRAA